MLLFLWCSYKHTNFPTENNTLSYLLLNILVWAVWTAFMWAWITKNEGWMEGRPNTEKATRWQAGFTDTLKDNTRSHSNPYKANLNCDPVPNRKPTDVCKTTTPWATATQKTAWKVNSAFYSNMTNLTVLFCKASENPWLLPLCLFLQQLLPYSFHPINLAGVSLNPDDTDADYIHGLYFKRRRSLFKDLYLKINVNRLIVKRSHLQDRNDHSAATFISIPSVEPQLFCSGRRLHRQG